MLRESFGFGDPGGRDILRLFEVVIHRIIRIFAAGFVISFRGIILDQVLIVDDVPGGFVFGQREFLEVFWLGVDRHLVSVLGPLDAGERICIFLEFGPLGVRAGFLLELAGAVLGDPDFVHDRVEVRVDVLGRLQIPMAISLGKSVAEVRLRLDAFRQKVVQLFSVL